MAASKTTRDSDSEGPPSPLIGWTPPEGSVVNVAESAQLFEQLLIESDIIAIDGCELTCGFQVGSQRSTEGVELEPGSVRKIVRLFGVVSQVVDFFSDRAAPVELARRGSAERCNVFTILRSEKELKARTSIGI